MSLPTSLHYSGGDYSPKQGLDGSQETLDTDGSPRIFATSASRSGRVTGRNTNRYDAGTALAGTSALHV